MAGSWIRFLVVLGVVCKSLGVQIINCNNNKVEIFEDSPAPVTCGDITSTGDVVWRRGDGVNIGECSADGTCTTALYNDYRLRRSPQSTESQLTLVPDYRRHAGLTVTCHDRASLSTATCTLVITPNVTATDSSHHPSGSLKEIIVGVVTAVTVVVILITIIGIVINRRKFKFHAVTKVKPSNEKHEDFEEHINVVYHPTDSQRQQVADPQEHYYSTPDDVTLRTWSASTTTADVTNKEGTRHVTALYD